MDVIDFMFQIVLFHEENLQNFFLSIYKVTQVHNSKINNKVDLFTLWGKLATWTCGTCV